MPTQSYHPRPFRAAWIELDRTAGHYAVLDTRTGVYVREFAAGVDVFHWTGYAAQALAAERNLEHAEAALMAECRELLDEHRKAFTSAVQTAGGAS